jgi:hypothetical protein
VTPAVGAGKRPGVTPVSVILTNNHVVAGSTRITVTVAATGQTYPATGSGTPRRGVRVNKDGRHAQGGVDHRADHRAAKDPHPPAPGLLSVGPRKGPSLRSTKAGAPAGHPGGPGRAADSRACTNHPGGSSTG